MMPNRCCSPLAMSHLICRKDFECSRFRPSGSCEVASPCSRPLPHDRRPHPRPSCRNGLPNCGQMVRRSNVCFLTRDSLTISRFLASFIRPSDQLEFDPTAADPMRELRVIQSTPRRPRELYFVPIGYVTQPKPDKRDEYFVRAEVAGGRLGIRHLYLPNQAIRDYFYFGNRRRAGCEEQTLYDLLRVLPTATPVDLRLALKVRLLELQADAAPKDQIQAVERAFNLLAHPDLRSCYQALLLDPEAPALFPYGGFGSLLAAGELSPDRETFFAQKDPVVPP